MRAVLCAIFVCLPFSLLGMSQAHATQHHFDGTSQRVPRARTHRDVGRAQQGRRYAGLHHLRHLRRNRTLAAVQSLALAHEEPVENRDTSGIVTVNTAAGIPITVADLVASKFEGFISDLVASGYKPRQIHCLAHSGHARNSNHYWGGACDFDQGGRGRTASAMYHVGELARKWGLRDGCTFSDCGHVDVPRDGSVRIATRSRHRG
jgi:hypothetical protein